MFKLVRAGLLLLMPLAISGCFMSDFPLFTIFESVTPITEGRYTYVDTNGKPSAVIITIDGTVTKQTNIDDNGSAGITNLLIHEVPEHRGYYVVLSDKYYALIKVVSDREVVEYKESGYCGTLQGLAEENGEDLGEHGVEVEEGGDTCKFTSLNDLLSAFMFMIDNDALEVASTYTRQ